MTGTSVAKVIYILGQANKVDREALAHLVSTIGRFLDPAQVIASSEGTEVEIIDSRRLGGAYVLDEIWHRLGIAKAICDAAGGRRPAGEIVERVVFALVAQRV